MATTKTEKPKAASKVAAPKKAAAPKAAPAKKPAAEKKVATPKKATTKKSKAGPEERYRMTEVAAYFIAERDSFAGSPVDYWIAAEIQISKLLDK